jgi:hypothetical protein
MAKMCPMSGCKGKPGMCMHEMVILGAVIVVILAIIARYAGLF